MLSCLLLPASVCGLLVFFVIDAFHALEQDSDDDDDDAAGAAGGATAARSPVELRILNRRNGEPLSEDELPLRDFARFAPTDFSLEVLDRSRKASTLPGAGQNSYPTMYVCVCVRAYIRTGLGKKPPACLLFAVVAAAC